MWRDPWAWASVLALLPLLARCAGAPLGEPVAEDFDFLRRSLFGGVGSLLDGGGSTAFWRPVAHQLYYAALGPLITGAPGVVAGLHALLLASGALLFYRAFRRSLGGSMACIAATFPAFSESTRTLIGWPSQFVDVGLYFFSALALHEASRRRMPSALAAAAMALLCKELAVVTVLLLPWLPGVLARGERRRWLVACAALLVVWAGAYLAVRQAAHLALPHGAGGSLGGAAVSVLAHLTWAVRGSLRALASLTMNPGPQDGPALAIAFLLAAGVAVVLFIRRGARSRLAAARGWLAWGLAWSALSTAPLAALHPHWQPNRAHFGAVGAGVAAAVLFESAHPALAGALVAGRLWSLWLAPPAAGRISEAAPESGAFVDFEQLTRLQRFMRETRTALRSRFPTVAPGSNFVSVNLPRGLSYALGGDRAAQVWYRDTTLRIVNYTRLTADSTLAMVAGIQFQLNAGRQVVALSPEAMREQERAYHALVARDWQAALEALERADALEPDLSLEVFHGNNAGYRSVALFRLGRMAEAEQQARLAVGLDDRDKNGLRILTSTLILGDRLDEAARLLDIIDSAYRGESWVELLHADLAVARGRAGP